MNVIQARRGGRVLLAASVGLLSLLQWPLWARADSGDGDRALSAWLLQAKPTDPAARSGPPNPQHWERVTRGANSFGPLPLRDADQRLLTQLRGGQWPDALALIKTGMVDIGAQDQSGGGPLVLAAAAGQDEIVRELLKRGAELNARGEGGQTALGASALNGHRSTLRLLLRAGADPYRFNAAGQAPLHLAAITGRIDVMADLLKWGVRVQFPNKELKTAVELASASRHQSAMDWLLDNGASLENLGLR
jgi:ankyrin repeat protein